MVWWLKFKSGIQSDSQTCLVFKTRSESGTFWFDIVLWVLANIVPLLQLHPWSNQILDSSNVQSFVWSNGQTSRVYWVGPVQQCKCMVQSDPSWKSNKYSGLLGKNCPILAEFTDHPFFRGSGRICTCSHLAHNHPLPSMYAIALHCHSTLQWMMNRYLLI